MTRRKTIGIIASILLFGFVLRIPYFLHTMQDMDEGCYAGVAAKLMDGGLPYLHAVTNKPPGIFYVYQLTFSLFGKYNMIAIHMVTFLWTLATAIILSILARRLGGKSAALLALLFYLTFTAALYAKMIAANTEIFMALPYSLAVLLLWYACTREKGFLFFLSGLIAGLSPLFKQVGGVEIIAVFLYMLVAIPLLHGRNKIIPSMIACAEYGIGFVLPIGIVALLFYRNGILAQAIFWNLTYANRYINSGASSQNFLSQMAVEFVPFVLSTIILWILSCFWIKRVVLNLRDQNKFHRLHFSLFVILWFVVSAAVTFIGSRMFGHYFIQILPSLSLMAALFAGGFFDEAGESRCKKWRIATLALTIIPGIVFTGMDIRYEAATDTWGGIEPDFRPATEYIKAHTDPEDKIFVWGWFTPIYVYSERTPSTRFVNTHMHTGYKKGNDPNESDRADLAWQLVPEAWPMLETDLKTDPPELIVDTSPGNYHDFGRYAMKNYPILSSFIDENCRLEKSIAGTDIYRCGGEGGSPAEAFTEP